MPALLVSKSPPLLGEIRLHGAKNSVLPILAATLLCRTPCVLQNCPAILDVDNALAILRALGCECQRSGASVYIDPTAVVGGEIAPQLAASMRASSLFLGALLARTGQARLTLPGGCPIGKRPLDYHLQAFRALGAQTRCTEGKIECRAQTLRGTRLCLPGPSVGATQNAMLAALGGQGQTTIENAACEPEIVDLASFLRACGARIHGDGTKRIVIAGGRMLHGARYRIMPDRMEAATYLCACAACGGELTLRGAVPEQVRPVVEALRQSGCEIKAWHETLRIRRRETLYACAPVTARPYPGFATDAMPLLMAAQLTARGETAFTETIFENRFLYVPELRKLGAQLRQEGQTVFLRAGASLHGAALAAPDLRGGAALVLAGLCAEGESTIYGVKHIDRGYDKFAETLQSVGARLKTVEIPIKV